ncbi:RNA-binding protein [Patescibacteria group bacterium]|nr:RNA-binding protein [Patescibacteria group bacterium]MCL5797297.1 RNA-binding protein [Patescibacteria group bacterium]
MAKNLFVGSLPFSVTEDAVGQLFAKYGQVQSVNVIKDKYTGKSRGFGFVEMSTEEEAQKAIQGLNNYNLEGRNIIVKEALPKPTYTDGRGSDSRGRRSFGFGGRPQRRY